MATTKIRKGGESRIKELRAQVDRDPLNVTLRFMLSSALEAGGRTEESVREMGTAVEKARRNLGVALCNHAVGLMKVGKPQEALARFDLAIETDPSNASFYLNNKAHALLQLGLHDKAKAIYNQILQSKDASKETQRIALRRMGDLKKK